jgi:hypothetical protein
VNMETTDKTSRRQFCRVLSDKNMPPLTTMTKEKNGAISTGLGEKRGKGYVGGRGKDRGRRRLSRIALANLIPYEKKPNWKSGTRGRPPKPKPITIASDTAGTRERNARE